ncbi:Ulbp1 [Phodopus roborovskii]|uniref:Ulbp1 protein n=1 Tax=Phodopus roborovskii TaxID=109678 RepID=A0AAV0A9I9_PHORO|nr:Ulbp1 [Phodopus roborovskii]
MANLLFFKIIIYFIFTHTGTHTCTHTHTGTHTHGRTYMCTLTRSCLLVDTHSLSSTFIVKARSTPREPWFEGQCSANGVPFLQYDNRNKATPLGDLGKEVDATEAWTHLTQSLKHIFEELRKQVLNMEKATVKTQGHPTLQVTTISQYKGEQFTDALWIFTMSGQYSFHFYPMNGTWGVTHAEDRGAMKQWETNGELAQLLRKFSLGDSGFCLKEFLKHWKEMPRLTSWAPDITQISPATQSLHTRWFSNNSKSTSMEVVIPIIFFLFAFAFSCM